MGIEKQRRFPARATLQVGDGYTLGNPDGWSLWTVVAVAVAPVLMTLGSLAWLRFAGKRFDRDAKQRHADLAALALPLGAEYAPEDSTVLLAFRGMPFLPQYGTADFGKTAYRVLRGSHGSEKFQMFDLAFDSEYGALAIAMFQVPDGFPAFQLERRGIDRIADAAVSPYGPAIALRANPAFSRNFRLCGSEAAAIESLFSPALCEFLDAHGEWAVESTGSWLALCRKYKRPPVKEYPDFLAQARRIRTAFVGSL